jgi:methyl-accepting chemotaxis protein
MGTDTPVEDDRQRRRYLLGLIIRAEAVLLILSLPATVLLGLFEIKFVAVIALTLVSLLICYMLNRPGWVRLAGYCFVIVQVLLLLGRGYFAPATLVLELFSFFALSGFIVVAGLVIDEVAPFLVAFLGIGLFAGYFFGFNRLGTVPVQDRSSVVEALFFGGGLHIILAALAWGSARTVRRLLLNMSWQNEKLLEFNQQLGRNLDLTNAAGGTIAELADKLTMISHDQTERADNQVQSVSMVSATLEELSSTAKQIAEVAENVFTATEKALTTAENGGQAVGEGINGIETLRHHVEDITRIVSELNKQSNQIGEIVELITELAEETNLLALNATIEAAGAGEYGRRFAVVAAEVQDLSIRSRASARDVQHILEQIKHLISTSLVATQRGLDEATQVAETASQAGEAIEQIIETVENTTQLARQIYLTTQQQKSATDQAVEMIRMVAGDAREAAGGAQTVLNVSSQLGETAINLRQN